MFQVKELRLHTSRTMDSYKEVTVSLSMSLFHVWRLPSLLVSYGITSFTVVHLLCAVLVGYPTLYLACTLGMLSRKGVLQCWDLAPIGRGIGWSMLCLSALTTFAFSIVSAHVLALLLSSFYRFLPWWICDLQSQHKECSPRHSEKKNGSDLPTEWFIHSSILELKRDGIQSGLGRIVWPLAVLSLVTWLCVYIVIINGTHSYSKIVPLYIAVVYFTLSTMCIGALCLNAMPQALKWNWREFTSFHLWCAAVEQVLMELSIAHGSHIALGSKAVTLSQINPNILSMVCTSVSVLTSLLVTVITANVVGSLSLEHGVSNREIIQKGPTAALVIWSDVVTRTAGSHFWSVLVFFTIFLTSVMSMSMLIYTITTTIFTSFPRLRQMYWLIMFFICATFYLGSIVTTCTQGGAFILGLIDAWPMSAPSTLLVGYMSFVISYVYGQRRFCGDILCIFGQYPCVYLRICWKIIPFALLLTHTARWMFVIPSTLYGRPTDQLQITVGRGLCCGVIAAVPTFTLLYFIFWLRVRIPLDTDLLTDTRIDEI